MDGQSRKVSFVSDKHVSVLDNYLGQLLAKLATSFLDLLDDKQALNLWVAVFVRYSHPNNYLSANGPNVLHSGKRIVTSPLLLDS